jgi:hypothetical protein
MATLTLKLTNLCPAGNHFTLTATGDVSHTVTFSANEFSEPVTEAEKDAFIKLLVKFAKIGRTATQVKTALTNGAVVTV